MLSAEVMEMNIAIYGAGSLGTIMGAYLSETYPVVDLIDTNKEHVARLNENGAHVVGPDMTQRVTAFLPEEITKTYDIVLLLTKQLYNPQVLPAVKAILKEDGILVSLQNGVPEEIIRQHIPSEQIIAGSVEFGATYVGPGQSRLTTDYAFFKKYALQIGELDGATTDRIVRLKEVLDTIGGTEISDNLPGTKWSKLIINSAFSGLSAACNATYGDVLDHPVLLRAAIHAMKEVLDVGHAHGIEFARMGEADLTVYSELSDIDQKMIELPQLMNSSRNLEASMLQDLRKHQPTEIDYINGVVTMYGETYGIPTPVNSMIQALVRNAQDKQEVTDFEQSVEQFKALLAVK